MDETKKEQLLKDASLAQKQTRFTFFSKLLQRYFKGTANKKEIAAIEAWDAEAIWEKNRKVFDDKEMDESCNKLWDNIALQLQFDKKTNGSMWFRTKVLVNWYAAAAAALIFLASGTFYFIYQSPKSTIFQTGNTETKQLTLPDGTRMFLNRETKLSYIAGAYNKRQREVWLEGEAFFEVEKNPQKPFIIHSGKIQTTVRGTSFNIQAYPQLNENIVSVRSGKVEVISDNKIINFLTKNQQLIYYIPTGGTKISDVSWEEAACWMDGRLVFHRANLDELKLRLKQFFDVELEVRDSALYDDKTLLNSSFRKGASMQEVLDVISLTLNAKYEINSSGKVIIYSRN